MGDYKEALKIARKIYESPTATAATRTFLEQIFPEFLPEGERIRREIIEFIQWAEDFGSMRMDWHQAMRPGAWINWLESKIEDNKQGPHAVTWEEEHPKEQKPAEKTSEEYVGLLVELRSIYQYILQGIQGTRKKNDPVYSQSEIIRRLIGLDDIIKAHQSPWKPTEEQLNAFDAAIGAVPPAIKEYDWIMIQLDSLRQNLQALKSVKIWTSTTKR